MHDNTTHVRADLNAITDANRIEIFQVILRRDHTRELTNQQETLEATPRRELIGIGNLPAGCLRSSLTPPHLASDRI